MRRFQYFIDLDRTVRIDDKGNGDPPWPKLFGIFNSFCNISLKRCKIIRLALFKAGQGSYWDADSNLLRLLICVLSA